MSLQEIHDVMYRNILLLTYVYPANKEFKKVFTASMFIKNNKAAFQEVVYYLLQILNAEIIKTKITYWPPMSPKEEVLFRNQVMAYINELNGKYTDANIPVLMTSHLISPGGIKFVKFMLKLSELVLKVHLRNDSEIELTLLERCSSNSSLIVNTINQETMDLKEKFVARMSDLQQQAEKLKNLQEEYKILIPKLTEEKETLEKEEIIQIRENTFSNVITNIDCISQLSNTIDDYKELASDLQVNNLILENHQDTMQSIEALLLDFQNVIEKNKIKFVFSGSKIKKNIDTLSSFQNDFSDALMQLEKSSSQIDNIYKILSDNKENNNFNVKYGKIL